MAEPGSSQGQGRPLFPLLSFENVTDEDNVFVRQSEGNVPDNTEPSSQERPRTRQHEDAVSQASDSSAVSSLVFHDTSDAAASNNAQQYIQGAAQVSTVIHPPSSQPGTSTTRDSGNEVRRPQQQRSALTAEASTAVQRIEDWLRSDEDAFLEMPAVRQPIINSVDVRVDGGAISVNVQASVGSASRAEPREVEQESDDDVIDLTQERAAGSHLVDLTQDEGYPLHRSRNVIDLTDGMGSDTEGEEDNVDVGAVAMDTNEGATGYGGAMENQTKNADEGASKTVEEKRPTPQLSEGDEGCPICFEEWSNSGEHRLVSLKCGHLFGQSCIEAWFKSAKKCPQCNAKSKKSDIRVIYAKRLKVIDTTERDRALQDLKQEKDARSKLELEAADWRLKYQMIQEEHKRLKQMVDQNTQREQISRSMSAASSLQALSSRPGPRGTLNVSGQYKKLHDILVSVDGQCRVSVFSPILCQLVVSVPSNVPLFRNNFGVKKISMMDRRNTQHVHIHKKTIRDMSFKPSTDDGLLLSVSVDKTVKVTSLMTNTVVQTWDAPSPVWSCCWDRNNNNYFYTGLVNGSIIQYDVRDTSKCVREFNNNCTKPVVSLCYLSAMQQMRCSGLLVGQMDEITFYETQNSDSFRPHKLAVTGNHGNLISVCNDPNTNTLLATFRPGAHAANPTVSHQLFRLAHSTADGITAVSATSGRVFTGGNTMRLMTRPCLVNHPESGLLACVGDEAAQAIHIWRADRGGLLQSLKCAGTVVDVCGFEIGNTPHLVGLTEKEVRVFKWSAGS